MRTRFSRLRTLWCQDSGQILTPEGAQGRRAWAEAAAWGGASPSPRGFLHGVQNV